MSSHLRTTRPPFPTRLVLITCLLLMGLSQPSVAQIEDSSDNTAVSVVFSEVSETKIVGQSPELGIKLSAVRENDNDVVSIQLSDNKTVVLSRNVGNLNFYVSSNQLDTATSFVAEGKESTTIDALAEYLWQYHGYSALGDTLLDALLVLSNWPQGVVFEEPELSTDDPKFSGLAVYRLAIVVSPTLNSGKVISSVGGINCGNGSTVCNSNLLGNVTLTATPTPGYSFKEWSGACTGTATTCTVSMTAAKSVTATFVAQSYPLSIIIEPKTTTGKVFSWSPPSIVNCGYNGTVCSANVAGWVQLYALASATHVFSGWSNDSTCVSNGPICNIQMTTAKTVKASFKPVTLYYILSGTENRSTYSSSSPLLPALSYNLKASLSGTKLTFTISRRDGLAFDANYPYPASNPLGVSISGHIEYQYGAIIYTESLAGKTLISYTHDVSLGEFFSEYYVSINQGLYVLGPIVMLRK